MVTISYFKIWEFGQTLVIKDQVKRGVPLTLDAVRADDNTKKQAIRLNIIMFVGIFVGVFFSEAILSYFQGSEFIVDFSWIDLIVSLVITFLVMPGAYMYVMDAEITAKSILVKLGLFVQSGVFWELLVSNIRIAIAG